MTDRRQVLAGLAWLLAPGVALAQGQGKGGKDRGPGGGQGGGPGGAPGGKAARQGGPGAGQGAGRGPGHQRGREASLRGPAGAPDRDRPGRGDGPSLRPVDREQVRGWLVANPDWRAPGLPPGQQRRLAQGKPLPPGIARQALPPGLAATLPYFPGYHYVAVGPDLVLVAAATGIVASLLIGALAR
ncbi:anti-virulence regulator CigR family protein [Roseicella aerolata]|uniref:RcnB family protein n=1 Tax=Roseicella aerolata TaxID=2883479 RepID=A0A9X1L8L8_9PROT|nr:anti-virulence regulator CigR family protein [Roseicella aerolata]MCB4822639.1 RcnB family protein [Roseicella aerolata]